MLRILFTVSLLTISLSSHALNCPASFSDAEFSAKVEKLVAESESCELAAELALSCLIGSVSASKNIINVAIKKCESNFEKNLSSVVEGVYKGLQKECRIKYSATSGSFAQVLANSCALDVTKLFNSIYSRDGLE